MRRAPFGLREITVALAWMALARPAPALAAAFSLAWDAPDGCPSEAAVRAATARWLDQSTPASGMLAIEARAEVTRTESVYVLDLSVKTASGTSRKRMTSTRCETFADVVALQLSLLATPAPRQEQERDQDSFTRAHSGTAPALRGGAAIVGARVSAGGGSGPTPGLAPALGLAASLRFGALRLELAAHYGLAVRERYAEEPGVGASFELFAGEARGCYALVRAPFELPLCLGGEFGVVRGRGFGVADAFTAERPWSAVQLVQAVRWPSSSLFSGWAELGGAAALLRPSFGIRNLDRLYRTAPLVFRAALGIELQID